jgi:membrane protease YdiL (CAAX protease family)
MPESDVRSVSYRVEAPLGLAYFGVYFVYLFANPENEAMHWLTLVFLPLALLHALQIRRGGTIRDTFASVGLRKSNWKTGLRWAAVLGLSLSILQLFVSNRGEAIWALIVSGKALVLLPIAFVLLFFTAAFTEEFFFRGIIQGRLGAWFQNKIWAVLLTSVLFGMYHIPYAYLNPNWPTHGQLGPAIGSAMGQGVIGGLVLGTVYERSGRNLVAPVLVHALINLLPAMTMIRFGGA